ncbi:hypothetical protein [Staphylococcus equorum]|uniref:Uncharacterized protein n=1 Tax=Staphylococcus equorum TaxID=246432 RepID=A0AAP7LTV0_9STAP|nr:hypothetical protein [Staphylococcus equorum]OEK56337.1 hypothetical protein ASS94_07030 [Staphylococcus equorum]
MTFWIIATILLGFIILSLLIFVAVIESKKDEKIFELSKKNIILQHEVERLLKDKEFETKQFNRVLTKHSRMEKYNTGGK